MSKKQRRYIQKKRATLSVGQMAEELGVKPDRVRRYLGGKGRDRGGQDGEMAAAGEYRKVGEYLADFSFRRWLQENRWWLLGLAGLVLLAYINVWRAEFVSDDVLGIVKNPRIAEWSAVWANPWGMMRPLYYYIVASTVGLVPAAFRAINVMSHVVAVWVVYWLVMALVNKRTAGLAAVLFAVHPVAVESVTWISGGAHSQLAAVGGAALVLYLLGRGSWGRKGLLAGWLALLGALLFSEKAVMIPGLLLLYHLVFDWRRGWWKGWLPYLGLSLVWVSVFAMQLGGRVSYLATQHYVEVSRGVGQWWTVPVAVMEYLKLSLWPVGLTLYHSETSYSVLGFGLMVAGFVIFLSLMFWLYWRAPGRGGGGVSGRGRLAFWLAWLVVALSPTLVPYGLSWLVAERYVYMGLMGVAAAIAMGFDYLSRKRGYFELTMALFGLVVVLLLGRTWARNNDWKNQDNLWLAAARTSPSSPNNHNNLGDLYGRRGDLDKAVAEFQLAIKLKPSYADAYHNLANTYLQMGKTDLAEENYKKAIEFNPGLWQSYQNLAGLYYERGELKKAEEYLSRAVEIKPDEVKLLLGLGRVYWQTDRQSKAEQIWGKAIKLDGRAGEAIKQLKSQVLPMREPE